MEQEKNQMQQNNSLENELIEIDSIARMLKCSTRHVRRLADLGRIPQPVKLGALLRWIKADVDQWFIKGCPSCRKGGTR